MGPDIDTRVSIGTLIYYIKLNKTPFLQCCYFIKKFIKLFTRILPEFVKWCLQTILQSFVKSCFYKQNFIKNTVCKTVYKLQISQILVQIAYSGIEPAPIDVFGGFLTGFDAEIRRFGPRFGIFEFILFQNLIFHSN